MYKGKSQTILIVVIMAVCGRKTMGGFEISLYFLGCKKTKQIRKTARYECFLVFLIQF